MISAECLPEYFDNFKTCIITVQDTIYYQRLLSRKQNGEDLLQSFEWLGFPAEIIKKAFAWRNFKKEFQ